MTDTPMENSEKKSPLSMPMIVVALLVLAAVVAFGLNRNQNSETKSSDPTTEEQTESSTAAKDEAEVLVKEKSSAMMESNTQVVAVEGGSFYYKPNEIRAKKDQPITIQLTSVDMMHDFRIDELKVKTEIAKNGETVEVTFTPTEAGSFEFYCSVGSHRAQGMVGKLIVE